MILLLTIPISLDVPYVAEMYRAGVLRCSDSKELESGVESLRVWTYELISRKLRAKHLIENKIIKKFN